MLPFKWQRPQAAEWIKAFPAGAKGEVMWWVEGWVSKMLDLKTTDVVFVPMFRFITTLSSWAKYDFNLDNESPLSSSFGPNHNVFQTLTKWFFCLNLTKPTLKWCPIRKWFYFWNGSTSHWQMMYCWLGRQIIKCLHVLLLLSFNLKDLLSLRTKKWQPS